MKKSYHIIEKKAICPERSRKACRRIGILTTYLYLFSVGAPMLIGAHRVR